LTTIRLVFWEYMNNLNDVLYAEIGRRVFNARTSAGFTQEKLASEISLTRTSVTNIEKGKQKLLVHTLVEIASVLNVEIETLLPKINVKSDNEVSNKYLDLYSGDIRKFAESAFKNKKNKE
jgi:transcriptional regulator with XRE-family HTH domain